jgi:hypothetical protein
LNILGNRRRRWRADHHGEASSGERGRWWSSNDVRKRKVKTFLGPRLDGPWADLFLSVIDDFLKIYNFIKNIYTII